MRAWWWILITAHLVWGNPEQFKDDYENIITLETKQNSAPEARVYPSFIMNSKALNAKGRRHYEDDEREKKEMRFHSWGGKRYEDDEEDEIGNNIDSEESGVFQEQGDEGDVSWNLSSNTSGLESDELGKHFKTALIKRKEFSPAFYPWGGKRDPEMMNDLNYDNPLFKRNTLTSRPEKSRKRYPYFSSWAGKRATAFNSWGGKRDYEENRDYSAVNKDYSEAKKDVNDDIDSQVNINKEHKKFHYNLNSDSLQSEHKSNVQDHGSEKNNGGEVSIIPQEKELYLSVQGKFGPEFENFILKRSPAFNSWGGKRGAAFNSWGGKRAPAFNSWGRKRAPAFNSWGGKRVAAFNSWGGKRAPAFNSWGGKRAAAFNSWGGKRAPAFNSWGGKRAPAFNSWDGKSGANFNSWDGKRAHAFNSWGGKRKPAFNSWGGKRAVAFNSWGGKRGVGEWNEKTKLEYLIGNNNRDLYDVYLPVISSHENSFKTKNPYQDYVSKHATDNNFDKTKDTTLKNQFDMLNNDKKFSRIDSKGLKNYEKDNRENIELLGHNSLKKRIRPSFTSWSPKRSPLFSSWYGSKIPTVLLTSGKRKPAFSSWGGKRSGELNTVPKLDCASDNAVEEDPNIQKLEEINSEELPSIEEKTNSRKKREVECVDEKSNSEITIERDKRASGNSLKNRVFTRMMLQGGWPMGFQSRTHGKDFFAWGGKRSFDITTFR